MAGAFQLDTFQSDTFQVLVVPVAVPMRVPSIRIAPMVYRDILEGWMEPWRYSGLESRRGQKLLAGMSRMEMAIIERQRMSELVKSGMSLCHATTIDIFKGKELLTGEATFETRTPDKLQFGLTRKLLISQTDRLLGID